MKLNRRWLRFVGVVAIVAAFTLGGCDKLSKDSSLDKTAPMNAMRTHCIGRFLIDLPVDFEQHISNELQLYYGLDKNFRTIKVELVRPDGTGSSFERIVDERAGVLSLDQHFHSPSKSMLAFRQRVDDKTVLIRSYDSPDVVDSYHSQFYFQRGSAVAVFEDEVYAGEDAAIIEPKVLRAVERTTAMSSPDQAGRGTCFGSLLIDAAQDGETFMLSFRSKSLIDVLIQINMNSFVAESDGGLLKRWDNNTSMLDLLDFQSSTLRRGKVQIGGMPGEELLSKGKDHDHVVRGFTAETLLLKPATFAAPSLAISMNMGGQVKGGDYQDASLSEKDALALWDAIVKSIRLRPGAV